MPVSPVKVGDTLKYQIVFINQANGDANSVTVDYQIPNGLIYLDLNNSSTEPWILNNNVAQAATIDVLSPGQSDTICIFLKVSNLPTDEVSPDSLTTIAEISGYTDENDDAKFTDADSNPDGYPTNDSGGNSDDETDDEVEGDGSGDPNDPTDDGDPTLDEDDHDSEILYLCDVATIIDIEDPGVFAYGDILKFFVEVHNQGNGPLTNIQLQNLFGNGLEFVENNENTTNIRIAFFMAHLDITPVCTARKGPFLSSLSAPFSVSP